jgi:Ca2+-binding RTX toxin-like protein
MKKTGTNKGETIYGTSQNDIIDGKGGDDLLVGGDGNDKVYGGDGNDQLYGLTGSKKDGNDTFHGNAGDDTLDACLGNDKIYGDAGNDQLYVSGGNDLMNGGAGFDLVNLYSSRRGVQYTVGQHDISFQDSSGNKGTSTLKSIEAVAGSVFNDVLTGSKGDNYINGNLGNDRIDGAAGDDVLFNGGGKDTITGGSGKDFFGFNGDMSNVAKLTDFNVADDSFMFKGGLFTELTGVGASHTVHFNTYRSVKTAQIQISDGHDALDSDVRLIYDKTDGYIYYDEDGNDSSKVIAIASIGKDLALTADDFFVY